MYRLIISCRSWEPLPRQPSIHVMDKQAARPRPRLHPVAKFVPAEGTDRLPTGPGSRSGFFTSRGPGCGSHAQNLYRAFRFSGPAAAHSLRHRDRIVRVEGPRASRTAVYAASALSDSRGAPSHCHFGGAVDNHMQLRRSQNDYTARRSRPSGLNVRQSGSGQTQLRPHLTGDARSREGMSVSPVKDGHARRMRMSRLRQEWPCQRLSSAARVPSGPISLPLSSAGAGYA